MIAVTHLRGNMTDRVLIVDFGSQVAQLIARRARESGVYCEIHPCTRVDAAFLARFAPCEVIFSDGPASVTEANTPRTYPALLAARLPVLGICYSQQTMVERSTSVAGRCGLGERHGSRCYDPNFSSMRSSFSSCRPMRASR